MKTKATNTTEYIAQFPKWSYQLTQLQKILEATELTPGIKWGAPIYMINGKNVIGMAGFKNHCSLWFHKGADLPDPNNMLTNAQPGKTQNLRHMKFVESDPLPLDTIAAYVQTAIDQELERQGG